MPKLDGKHYKYTKKGMMEYLKDKKKKKRKKNNGSYGDSFIPLSGAGEQNNPGQGG